MGRPRAICLLEQVDNVDSLVIAEAALHELGDFIHDDVFLVDGENLVSCAQAAVYHELDVDGRQTVQLIEIE